MDLYPVVNAMFGLSREMLNVLERLETCPSTICEEELSRARYWTCGGELGNIIKTIGYAITQGYGFTYWGVKFEDLENLVQGLERAKGPRIHYRKLVNTMLQDSSSLNIVFIYQKGTRKVFAAGIVTSIEVSRHDLFWPDEINNGRVIYPYRLRMYIIWLPESIIENPNEESKWTGVEINYNFPPQSPGLSTVGEGKEQIFIDFLKDKLGKSIRRLRELFNRGMVNLQHDIYLEQMRQTYQRCETELTLSIKEFIKQRFVVSEEDEYIVHELEAFLRSNKRALLLVGPPGSGKTELVRIIASALKYRLIEVSCHEYISRTDLIGDFILAGNQLRYRAGALVRALAMLRGRCLGSHYFVRRDKSYGL